MRPPGAGTGGLVSSRSLGAGVGRTVLTILRFWLCLALLGSGAFVAFAQPALSPRASEIVMALDASRTKLAAALTERQQTNSFPTSYTTVWRQFEDAVIEALCDLLPRHVPGLSETNFDRGRPGREKNRVADLAIVCPDGAIEISIKSARAGANPENDLGTFRDYPQRKRLFMASFTAWVRYADTGGVIRAERVFFDRTWRFVGRSTLVDGVKYRKKDGNMRPKPWAMFDADEAFWDSEAEFEAAVKRAELFRANELIQEYLDTLSETDQRRLFERLKSQFEPAAARRP